MSRAIHAADAGCGAGLGRGLGRRALLGGAFGAMLAGRAQARAQLIDPVHLAATVLEQGAPMLRDPTLLVAGPADAGAGRWAGILAARLGNALSTGAALPVSATGGLDGVTGANAFEALTNQDGSTALLVPGSAAIAWLAGDPRVHFDAGRWVPALAGLSSAVLVARPGQDGSRDGQSGRSLRLAVSSITGPELPALLGLSMLGVQPIPVPGLAEPREAEAALAQGRVDAVFLTGRDVPARLAALRAGGHVALFSLGGDAADPLAPDPSLADVPSFAAALGRKQGRTTDPALYAAWRAAAAASRIEVALVLPLLAPPALVARWRSACQTALSETDVRTVAQGVSIDAVPAPACVQALARIDAGETAQLALRRWIAAHPAWRMG